MADHQQFFRIGKDNHKQKTNFYLKQRKTKIKTGIQSVFQSLCKWILTKAYKSNNNLHIINLQ